MKNYLIVANGNFLAKEIIQEAAANKMIVALDGAAHKLKSMQIMPQIIAGDFDSLSAAEKKEWGIHDILDENEPPYAGLQQTLIVPTKDQNVNDLVKAIRYCDSEHADSITLICASGGELDHQESALRALRTEYKKDRPLLLHTEQQTVRYAKNEEVILQGKIGDRCGILAFPQGVCSSQGLRYDMTHMPLEFGFSDSTSNTLMQPRAVLAIQGEALIVMPPQLISQREFMSKTDVERLEILLRDAKNYSRPIP